MDVNNQQDTGLDNNNILLIEDDPGDAYEVEEVFADRSTFTVFHFDRLAKSLDFLKDRTDIDIILLDLHLPDGSGTDLLQQIRSAVPDIPIIVLTGLDDEKLAIELVKDGVQDYLVKGNFNETRLIRAIRYAVERQRAILELEHAREAERRDAHLDELTGLPNRKLFLDRLHNAITQAKRYKRLFAVLFIDLDGFKTINDTLGHQAGDQLLVQVANQLADSIRSSDTAARFGGDEFTMIINQLSEETSVNRVVNQIREKLRKSFKLNGEATSVSASIGLSIYPFDGTTAQVLIKNADTAMYQAKAAGKNTFRRYNISMDKQIFHAMQLEKKLKHAIENDELSLHYQPLIDIASDSITSVEALIRWHDKESGETIYPDQFIPIAEKSNIINPLGEWIMNRACMDIKTMQQNGCDNCRIAVNLSTRQFNNQQLHRKLIRSLDSNHVDPQHLTVEITESNAMYDIAYTIKMLGLLRDIGIDVAIDDFGTGYSSLNYLKRLPATTLKIDRSFVSGIAHNENDKSITSAIVAMAKQLSLEVVAEGVETDQQLCYLRELHCNKAQGFHFSRPLDFVSLTEFMENRANSQQLVSVN